jgi:hypothetical protein
MADLARYVNLSIRLKEGDPDEQPIIDKIEREKARNKKLNNSTILLMALMIWAELPDLPEPDNDFQHVRFLVDEMSRRMPVSREIETMGSNLARVLDMLEQRNRELNEAHESIAYIKSLIEDLARRGISVPVDSIPAPRDEPIEDTAFMNKMLARRQRRQSDEE